jgi:hypothetical protein
MQLHEKGFLKVKRALALAVMLASAAAMSGQAQAAAAISQYGSVKLQWNVAPVMNAIVHTSYTAGFAYAAPTGNLSNPAGTCPAAGGAGNADLTADFGTINPSLSATVACTYLNAVGVSVQTNDNLGFKVYEYMDAALPAGINVCAFPNTGAAFPMTPGAAITQSTRSGVGPAVYGGSCAAGGAAITYPGAGVLTNSGVAPAQPNAAYTGEYLTGAVGGTGQQLMGQATAAGTAVLAGEDLQLNVGPTATSGAQSAIMTLMFISN